MNWLNCFYAFMTALFAALIMVPFLRRWALDRGDLDKPDERKVHKTPTPRLGGVAIFLAFLFASIIYIPVTDTVRGMLAGALIVFAIGVIDDLNGVNARHKLMAQIAACLVTIFVGKLYLTNLGNLFGFGDIVLPVWAAIPFTLFAVVGMINAMNLIDGLDGLAGGVSMVALSAFFLLGVLDEDVTTMLLSAAAGGAILGFLKYNFYPARIFMGDTGSLVLGFVLGFLAVHVTQHPGSTVSPMAPILILGLPLVDTVWVMTKRIANGDSPMVADRNHVHHKFLDLGFKHRFTVVVIYVISLAWACIAVALHSLPEYLLLLLFVGSSVLFYLGLRYMLDHSDDFPILNRDAAEGIRSTATFVKISAWIDGLLPAVKYLLAAYLVLAAWSVVAHNTVSWQAPLILLVCGGYFWRRPRTKERQFLMLVIYIALGVAAIEVWHADMVVFGAVTAKSLGDALLLAAGSIAGLKFLFRRAGELFLSSSDFLILGICVLFALAMHQNIFPFGEEGALMRGVIALLAVRSIAYRSRFEQNLIVGAVLGFMALVVVVGLLL